MSMAELVAPSVVSEHADALAALQTILPQGAILCSLQTAATQHRALVARYLPQLPEAASLTLETLAAEEGLFCFIPADCVLAAPLHLNFSAQTAATMRQLIIAEQHSKLCLYVDYAETDAHVSHILHVLLQPGAQLEYYKLQATDEKAEHHATLWIEQKEASCFTSFIIDVGGQAVTEKIHVNLAERLAQCALYGLYDLTNAGQALTLTPEIKHIAPHTNSTMLYKGVLNNPVHAVFNGKVYVAKGAEHIQAEQGNHNLLLSAQATVDARPQLEIYADAVKCTHGATIGQLDQEALFYLRARGIAADLAEQLLTQGFVTELLDQIPHQQLKAELLARLNYPYAAA